MYQLHLAIPDRLLAIFGTALNSSRWPSLVADELAPRIIAHAGRRAA